MPNEPASACPPAGRARPLPPDERRDMLIAATLPLVAEHGPKVTTRQIAQAAGVAEGTIFRVFPDKDALVKAAVDRALDPAPTVVALGAIDPDLPLRERLTAVVEVLQRRFLTVFNLMIALGMKGPPPRSDQDRQAGGVPAGHAVVMRMVEALLAPDAEGFRLPVGEVVRLIRLLTFAGSHPLITDNHLLTPDEIVGVLLDGTRHPPPTDHGEHRC